jgi:predicted nucleic acid-binding protein
MKLIITDTNVFFDIISIDALPEFFAIDFEICTTDFVVSEILRSHQREQVESFIRAKKLIVFELSIDEIDCIRNFKTTRFFKGITDKTVLWKSQQLNCPLLTGDKKIRNEAEDLNIEVHGSIWVIQKLITDEVVSKQAGTVLLEKLKASNTNLPHHEIDKLIRQLR